MRHINSLSSSHLLRVKNWRVLRNVSVHFNNVSLECLKDIELFYSFPRLHCKTLYIINCEDSFISTWVRENIFPEVSEIYLNRSTGIDLVKRFPAKIYCPSSTDYIVSYYNNDLNKMLEKYGNVTVLSEEIEN